MRFRLRDTTVTACRWHGNHTKKDAFKEIEETFGIKPNSGRIFRQLNGVIGVDVLSLQPGQWMVRDLKEEPIAMDDDLFRILFKPVPEMHICTTEDLDGWVAPPSPDPPKKARKIRERNRPDDHPPATELSAADPRSGAPDFSAGTKRRRTKSVK
jgi:hypothetical protein